MSTDIEPQPASIRVFANRIPEEEAATAIAAIPDNATSDELAELYQHIDWFYHQAKRLKEALEERFKAIIKTTGNRIEWKVDMEGNTKSFYLGHDKVTKCNDQKALLLFFFEKLSADDLEVCLKSGAFKHGAFKTLLKKYGLEDEFTKYFTVEVKDKLETGETAPKELQIVDSRFL